MTMNIHGNYALLAVILAGAIMGLVIAGIAAHIPAGF
jgi:hypothetical protein